MATKVYYGYICVLGVQCVLGMSLIFTKSIIQHVQYKFYIDIRIEIIQKISIFSRAIDLIISASHWYMA